MATPADQSTEAALKILQSWQWRRCTPDGERYIVQERLSEVVSRLAMAGVECPDDVVLALLCRGDLIARGDYRWRKYAHGKSYSLEGEGETIDSTRWQALADSMSAYHLSDYFGPPEIELTELGLGLCETFDWVPSDERFSMARQSLNSNMPVSVSMEEWFTARNIEVFPEFSEIFDDDELPDENLALHAATPTANMGGRPPAADWESAALQLAGKYYRGDFKPKTKADVQRELASLLAESDIHPAPSTLAPHAKLIFEAFAAWERE